MKRGTAVRVAAVVALAPLLTACGAEHDPLFVTGTAAKPTLGWRDCPAAKGDGITEAALYEWDDSSTVDDPGRTLWHIEATDGTTLSQRIRLGTVPDGFTTQRPLTAALDPGTTYALRVNMASDDQVSGFLTFRPEQLAPGQVVFDESSTESRAAYDDRDNEEFGCFTE
ncbi:hypothetical protein [Streptomyces ossamyceticus]|uniref:hypothetical protein n=1 Tax=Streptomyces ossamyceticus TaxID=249581 RepID=UPI0012FEE613|nr:hypothetical protein [Streptomyces ossamyceticus]